ncbi:sugar phosphate isomerase/epimerase family protein [Halovivax gelatinilyticus]|uniref:sugar phosphate isomerase/epimerase family protein n=1 Tax=Halovivax gelatinilyticus TaxID=2961597 RepID=UPI0020CA386C|nr:sugar phosphate isomerase/epimerase [Halovivax gelatinilyticus]
MDTQVGLTVGDSLDRFEATVAGFDFAELSIGDDTAIDRDSIERIEAIRTETGTDLCVHLPYEQVVATGVAELDDAIIDYQSRLLALAGEMGATKAVLHGTVRKTQDTDLRPVFATQLESIGRAATDAGVELVVENVGHQARGLPLSVLGDLASETDTAVCFDVGHAYMEDKMNGIERFLSGYADIVSHLHVHDVRSRGDTHLPIGAGEIEYGPVVERLEPFDGTIAVEVFTDDISLLRDSATRIRRAFAIGE